MSHYYNCVFHFKEQSEEIIQLKNMLAKSQERVTEDEQSIKCICIVTLDKHNIYSVWET